MNKRVIEHESATAPAGKPPLSPRRRRLRWTAAILAAVVVGAISAATVSYMRHRPALYRPDESSADITSSLARDLPAQAPQPHFSDVTSRAGLSAFRAFIGARTSQLPEDMGSGAAWGDFNNDGHDDLFLVSAGGPLNAPTEKLAACELYENLGNGTFRKVDGFPELRIHGMGAAWGDYDGDGFLDLIVSGYNTLQLFHNEHGTGRFVRDKRFPDRPGFWAGVSWGDYDNDRNLDLYVCGYVRYVENEADRVRNSSQLGTAVPYTLNPASYEPAVNLLFHNNGDGTFTEVAEKLGVTNPTGRSLGALWHDFDNDGWLDLYVANDIAGSVFYHNTHGGFEDASSAAWVTDYRSAMGLAAGDYNRDGDDDLFVTHWVAQENALFDNMLADSSNKPPQAGTVPGPSSLTNAIPQASPKLRFMDLNEARGLGQIALPYVGWGTEFADFDGDGWLDLIVANGNTLEADGPYPKKLKPQEAFLFWNQKGEFFHNLAPLCKPLSEPHNSRGLAVSDFDNDGAMDILLMQLGEGVQLLHNDMQSGHWFKARLHSRLSNGAPLGFGDGATVIAHLPGGAALRRTVSSTSYLSQSSRVLHFGLGAAAVVESLEVHWLGGQTSLFTHLAANRTWDLTEGEATPRTASESASGPRRLPDTPDKATLAEFWHHQRAAMNALKVEKDVPKAIGLFRAALVLNPNHEDAHYYLGNCLAMQGDVAGALEQFKALTQINPQSHRGHAQWGTLRALSATTDAELAAAEESLQTAHQLNPEETGVLLVMGEVALLRGDRTTAEQRCTTACRTNPKAVGGLFLRGYLAWERGDAPAARALLQQTRDALGKDWQPKGATSEGDVQQKWHIEKTPLSRYWERWDGSLEPAQAFLRLQEHLRADR